jgi:5-methylcytosine-specific restriction protein A
MSELFYAPVDPSHIKKERAKAKELRQSQWWKQKLSKGICHYCENKFAHSELTMDHIVPVGRGGTSTKGNVVPSCKECNTEKSSRIPVEDIFSAL